MMGAVLKMKQELDPFTEDNELMLVPDPFLENSCSFLGVENDPGTPMGYPTPDNRCYAFKPALQVDLEKQRRHCLSDCYAECLYYQQQRAETPAEKSDANQGPGYSRRFVNGRTLALGMMLILILLAVLIWWPPPGTSMEEGTVFGVSFTLNSPNVASESETAGAQQAAVNETDSFGAVGDRVVEEPAQGVAATAEQADEVERSKTLQKSTAQGATLNAPAVNEGAPAPAQPLSPPANSPPVSVEVAAEEPAGTAVENAPVLGETVEEQAVEAVPEAVDSGSADDQQSVQGPPAGTGDRTGEKGQFTPVAYGEQESDDEMLKVYQVPDLASGDYTKIARPELFDLLGRDDSAEWIKISTEGGLEGWVSVSDTGLGSWIVTLPEIELE